MKHFKRYMRSYWKSPYGIRVRSYGHFALPPDRPEPQRFADFAELFWCRSGSGEFHLNGIRHILHPGEIFCYPAGSFQKYRALSDPFEYYFLTIQGPAVPLLLTMLNITPGVKAANPLPTELFDRIERKLLSPLKRDQMDVLCCAFELLTCVAVPREENSSTLSRAGQIKLLIEEEFSNEDLDVNAIAERLRMHRVSLGRIFRKAYHITISDYLREYRLNHARSLLARGGMPIHEIAQKSGFHSVAYFSRSIRKKTGRSPQELYGEPLEEK